MGWWDDKTPGSVFAVNDEDRAAWDRIVQEQDARRAKERAASPLNRAMASGVSSTVESLKQTINSKQTGQEVGRNVRAQRRPGEGRSGQQGSQTDSPEF